ncbi:hypothetical protein SAMN05421736_106191 [Evansella caseinilytica]|uniref:Uncharacterized protein n=1 Tax=Evansella caseinilytica TaxID=1503961 RepID=A0A1H3QIB0_9BACI|nr:hypothetical protein SAMN05421736_106191 [Evansella caseinilytica]
MMIDEDGTMRFLKMKALFLNGDERPLGLRMKGRLRITGRQEL